MVCQVPTGTVGLIVDEICGSEVLEQGLDEVGGQLRTWERLLLGVTSAGIGVINLERLLSNQGLLLAQDY